MNMDSAHSDRGYRKVLAIPAIYRYFTRMIAAPGNSGRLVDDYIRPFPGCRILDIGCGPGDIVGHLPESIGGYVGFDMNAAYIEDARARWARRTNCTFFCQRVEEAAVPADHFDIVLAIGVLHHLDDADAGRLFEVARHALRSKGLLITYDGAFTPGQHWIAALLLRLDRGKAVRTVAGYRSLALRHFGEVEGQVRHDTLRLPYTVLIMTCQK